jgi:hypothetical protein
MVAPTFMSKGLASAGGELFTAFKGLALVFFLTRIEKYDRILINKMLLLIIV